MVKYIQVGGKTMKIIKKSIELLKSDKAFAENSRYESRDRNRCSCSCNK